MELILAGILIGILAVLMTSLFDLFEDTPEETHTTVFLTVHIHAPQPIDDELFDDFPNDEALDSLKTALNDFTLEGLLTRPPRQ